MELLVNLLRFILILGILVFIHELGHFVVAKKVGIYVFRFSIGFGKRILGWKHKGTDYCLSLIPFGGYVKMAGQEDVPSSESEQNSTPDPDLAVDVPEDQKFYNKTVLQRLAVVFAGPFMNFVLALVLFVVVYFVGLNVPAFMKSTAIGDVLANSPAEAGGLQIGDEILSINGKKINEWRQITRVTLFNIDNQLDLEIKRGNNVIHKVVTPAYFNKNTNPGIGVLPYIQPQVKEVLANSPAETGGLQKNDIIVAVNGKKVSFNTVVDAVKYSNNILTLDIIRDGKPKRISSVQPKKIGTIRNIQIYHGRIAGFDSKIFSDIHLNDAIISIDSTIFQTDDEITNYLTAHINKNVVLALRHEEKTILKKIASNYTVMAKVVEGNKIGVVFEPNHATVLEKYPLPQAIWKGTQRTFGAGFELFAALYYLLSGKISPRELAGPVGIYKITTDFAKSGFVMLLSLIAFLSVNLCIINLLPIPVLDGGHILFLTIEGIRRKPLNEKFVLVCQKIGMVLLLLLIVYTFYNDIFHRLIGK